MPLIPVENSRTALALSVVFSVTPRSCKRNTVFCITKADENTIDNCGHRHQRIAEIH